MSPAYSFWTALPFTFATVRANMKASKAVSAGVKKYVPPFLFCASHAINSRNLILRCSSSVMTTIWGDEGNEFDFYSALPGMLYQAEHAYTPRDVDEVDATLLRRKFDGIVGADLDDYIYASKLEYVYGEWRELLRSPGAHPTIPFCIPRSDTQPETQPIDAKTHYCPNLAKFLLWEGNDFPSRVEAQQRGRLLTSFSSSVSATEPFFSFLSPQYDRTYDLESHYSHLATYLEQALSSEVSTMSRVSMPHSLDDVPMNHQLRLPYLLASVLSLKCHLRQRLVAAYKSNDREELEALGGAGPLSRMSRLRALVKKLHAQHRCVGHRANGFLVLSSVEIDASSHFQRELVFDVQTLWVGSSRLALRRPAEPSRNDARSLDRLSRRRQLERDQAGGTRSRTRGAFRLERAEWRRPLRPLVRNLLWRPFPDTSLFYAGHLPEPGVLPHARLRSLQSTAVRVNQSQTTFTRSCKFSRPLHNVVRLCSLVRLCIV